MPARGRGPSGRTIRIPAQYAIELPQALVIAASRRIVRADSLCPVSAAHKRTAPGIATTALEVTNIETIRRIAMRERIAPL